MACNDARCSEDIRQHQRHAAFGMDSRPKLAPIPAITVSPAHWRFAPQNCTMRLAPHTRAECTEAVMPIGCLQRLICVLKKCAARVGHGIRPISRLLCRLGQLRSPAAVWRRRRNRSAKSGRFNGQRDLSGSVDHARGHGMISQLEPG